MDQRWMVVYIDFISLFLTSRISEASTVWQTCGLHEDKSNGEFPWSWLTAYIERGKTWNSSMQCYLQRDNTSTSHLHLHLHLHHHHRRRHHHQSSSSSSNPQHWVVGYYTSNTSSVVLLIPGSLCQETHGGPQMTRWWSVGWMLWLDEQRNHQRTTRWDPSRSL